MKPMKTDVSKQKTFHPALDIGHKYISLINLFLSMLRPTISHLQVIDRQK